MDNQKRKVFVLDFAVHKPHDSWQFPRAKLRALSERRGKFSPEDIDFQERIAMRTGLGDETAVCPAIQSGDENQLGIEPARFEFGATCLTAVEDLLKKTGVRPSQVNFVITNSSLFNPTPSLSAIIMNHFKMGTSTINYSLGGMGCSAGVIALDLARELCASHPGSLALVVSHENITNNYYTGCDRSMLVCNCLFRSNGSAVLVSSRPGDAARAKYKIQHIVRTNLAADDVAYNCVMQTEDADRVVGVRLNKDLVKVGARALRTNMTALGPLPYTPDFKRAFNYFCIHTGGRGIIDGLEREMQLSRQQVEPSRASLYRFGNTSSTSVWYELSYVESRQGLAKGQKVWQLAFGSGFKFNSSVLVANRQVHEQHEAWARFDPVAMWAELDKLEAEAAAARAAKEKLSAPSGSLSRDQNCQ
eukprot:gene10997-11151_t